MRILFTLTGHNSVAKLLDSSNLCRTQEKCYILILTRNFIMLLPFLKTYNKYIFVLNVSGYKSHTLPLQTQHRPPSQYIPINMWIFMLLFAQFPYWVYCGIYDGTKWMGMEFYQSLYSVFLNTKWCFAQRVAFLCFSLYVW